MTVESLAERFALPAELEQQRLRDVDQLYLLDSPPEDRFAQITRMARCVMEVPMAAVSLLDYDRQWFKQCDGLDLDGSVPRELTVCQATIKRAYDRPADPALILEDTLQSDFCELPAICSPGGVRFYAGYPLYGPGGHPVGTFCVYDTKPRRLSATQRDALVELAAWAQRELQSADDLQRAADVQRRLLPPPLGDLPGYGVCALCLPAHAVGGDFYDHYAVPGGVVFTVADVMGKGMGAAILTATVRSALRGATRALARAGRDADIAEAVNATHLQVVDDLGSTDSFVTLFHLKLTLDDGTVEYVDAGHGFAAIVRTDGVLEPLNSEDLPLGVFDDDRWTASRVRLSAGDTLVVASDGLLDLMGERMGALLRFVAEHGDPAELCAEVKRLASASPPMDDITIVAVRRGSPP